MSKYYQIAGMKVRVSDHEPNTMLNGSSDIYFYTKSADNRKLCVASQVESYCDKKDMDISLFQEILNDFPFEVYIPEVINFVIVSQSFIDGYRAIAGKKSTAKKERYCNELGVDYWMVSQGKYKIN